MLIQLPNAFGDAATNMAIDAALLTRMPAGLAAFRHYGWLEPVATFGYAQSFQAVQHSLGRERSLCRRSTGGGIVDHCNDWTYALIIEASLACVSTPATTLYLQLHQAISHAIQDQGVATQLAPCPKLCGAAPAANNAPSQCFTSPAANDVLHPQGHKIAGAAMKRNRHGLLIQGSIDRAALPEDFDYLAFQDRLWQRLAAGLELPCGELEDIRPLFDSELIEHEKKRFASHAWTHKR